MIPRDRAARRATSSACPTRIPRPDLQLVPGGIDPAAATATGSGDAPRTPTRTPPCCSKRRRSCCWWTSNGWPACRPTPSGYEREFPFGTPGWEGSDAISLACAAGSDLRRTLSACRSSSACAWAASKRRDNGVLGRWQPAESGAQTNSPIAAEPDSPLAAAAGAGTATEGRGVDQKRKLRISFTGQ